jgi:hypothetical protein
MKEEILRPFLKTVEDSDLSLRGGGECIVVGCGNGYGCEAWLFLQDSETILQGCETETSRMRRMEWQSHADLLF